MIFKYVNSSYFWVCTSLSKLSVSDAILSYGGATLIDPATVWFSFDTRLGRDVTVGPNVVFGPGVAVADNVEIRGFCHIEGAEIGAGAIVGSGTVSNKDADGSPGKPVADGGLGYSCLAEVRMIETILEGSAKTPFMHFGDTVRIEMKDAEGHSIFGAIDQAVERYQPPR